MSLHRTRLSWSYICVARAFGAWIVIAPLPLIGACTLSVTDSRLTDQRDVLSADAEVRIGAFQEALLSELDVELGIDIPSTSPGDLQRYAHDLMESRRIGAETAGARGVLLVIDVDAALVRMEVGTDLEHVFPDAFVSHIEHDQMAPFFRHGKVGDGVEATVELLTERAKDAIAGGEYVPGRGTERRDFAAGGGAQARAPIDSLPPDRSGAVSDLLVPPQPSPAGALAVYVEILSRRDPNPHFEVYTPETRALLAKRLVTKAQQEGEYRQLRAAFGQARYVQFDTLAVARFENRPDIPPYFFRRGADGWMIDLASMAQKIRFDLQNRWFFAETKAPYDFAFD